MTPLDTAFAASQADPQNEDLLMRFYAAFAETELFLLLNAEAEDGQADPVTVDPGTGPVALAFDLEERLSGFTGAASPYLGLSGRKLAGLLGSHDLGVTLNLNAPSETLLDAETLRWLAGIEAETEARDMLPVEVAPPEDLPEALLEAVDRKLAQAGGLATDAAIVSATYSDQSRSQLLAIFDCLPEAQGAIANAIGEALAFSGLGGGWLDIAFLPGDSAQATRIRNVGLGFDIPGAAAPSVPKIPGGDPDAPPILR